MLVGNSFPFRRPPIPIELIRAISELANLVVLDHELSYSHQDSIEVRAHGAGVASKLWFTSEPFNRIQIMHIAGVQVLTKSHDQGWASRRDQGSWTWFDMAVLPFPLASASQREAESGVDALHAQATTDTVTWRQSHYNPIASRPARWLNGPVVTIDDVMWDGVQEGQLYVIAVRANAQYAGWANYGEEAQVMVWKYFEPVVEL